VTAEKIVFLSSPSPQNIGGKPTIKTNVIRSRKWLLAADITFYSDGYGTEPLPGLRAAFYKKWGGYLNLNYNRITGGVVYAFKHPASTEFSIYLGAGSIYFEDEYYVYNQYGSYYDYDYGYALGFDTGLMIAFKWFSLSTGLSVVPFKATYPTASIGVRF
jgi:hypothetical protein